MIKKIMFFLSVVAPIFLLLYLSNNSMANANTSLPRVTLEDVKFEGAFRIPGTIYGDSRADYAIGTIAYNPDRNSIYLAGHERDNAVAEFRIPLLKKEVPVSELETAENISPFRSVLKSGGPDKITGLYYENGKLMINSEIWYDANSDNVLTTLVLEDTENFSNSEISGYYKMQGSSQAAGYISQVPAEYQSSIGENHITGWSSVYSITSRYSSGPSMFAFNLENVLNGNLPNNEITTDVKMNFPYPDGIMGEGSAGVSLGSAPSLWNELSRGVYGFIIPGTRTFAVFGNSGGNESGIGYKITQTNGDVCGGYCPYDPNDNYNYYWLFDVDEILSAESVSSPRPYEYGKMLVPYDDNGEHLISGATYDAENNLLYFSLFAAGQLGRFDTSPAIVAYSIDVEGVGTGGNGGGVTPPPPPTFIPDLLTPQLLFPTANKELNIEETGSYVWKRDSGVESYLFGLYDITKREWIQKWTAVSASDICGSSSCSYDANDFTFTQGHRYRVYLYGMRDDMVDGVNVTTRSSRSTAWFKVVGSTPMSPEIINPREGDSVSSSGVTYEWSPTEGATLYTFAVYDRTKKSVVVRRNLATSDVCSDTICSFTPNITLGGSKNHIWYITSVNASGRSATIATYFHNTLVSQYLDNISGILSQLGSQISQLWG